MSYRTVFYCALYMGFAFNSLAINAKIYHTDGPTYPITEPDLLQVIQTTLQEKAKNGDLAHWQEQQLDAMKNLADRPTAVAGLTPALETRSWLFNPSVTISSGSQFNPLDKVTWTDTLIFYDADNPEQVKWVQQLDQELKGKDKLILVNGSVSEQTKLFQKRIFFDQSGMLILKFNIQHMPATVAQDGQFLRITEFRL